jgi:hypothetical protein
MRRSILGICILCLLLMSALPASANSAGRLYFENLKDMQRIGNHYDNFGITFSSNALAVTSSLFGGIGNFTNNPSGRNVMAFDSGTAAIMNVAGGFSTGLAFFYSATNMPGFVTVWSGENGTGSMLANIQLAKTGSTGCQQGSFFCVWSLVGVEFDGVAKSVSFGGTAGQIAFDSVSLGSSTPSAVPESSSVLLLGIGLVALACFGHLRKLSSSHG